MTTTTNLAVRPTEPAAPRAGEMTVSRELEHGLSVVLSHMLGGRGTNHSRHLTGLLRRCAHTPAALDDGRELAPLAPTVPLDGPCPDARRVLRTHGTDNEAFRDEWRRRRLERGGWEPMDVVLLGELVPRETWPALAGLIAEGPVVAAARVERALLIESERPLRRVDRRHSGRTTMSDNHVIALGMAARALFLTLVDLSLRSALFGEALAAWERAPEVVITTTGVELVDTTAPSRQQVRLLWQELQADFERRVPDAAGLGERPAIEALRERQLHGLWRLLRLRALVVLLAVVGARSGAILRLRVRDFVHDHKLPDGRVGPALALRPGKTMRGEKISYKPLPAGAAAVIDALLTYRERILGRPLDPDAALLSGGRESETPWDYRSMAGRVAGNPSAGQRALIARNGDPMHGYTPHNYRSWAAQQVRSLEAHEYLAEHRISADQHWTAEALLDHRLPGVDALYGGASKDRDRERLSGVATTLTWELLTTHRGARRVIDGAAYERALRGRLALAAELQWLSADVDQAFAPVDAPATGDRGAHLLERMEALMHAHALVRRERQTYEQLLAVERELERLRHDGARMITVPDDAPDDAVTVDLAAIEAAVRGEASGCAPDPRPAAVRAWLAPSEFRYVAEASNATIPRWLGQGGRPPQLPHPDGDPRNPWPADRVPVDDSLGERRRRIIVAGISETWLLAVPGRLERLEAILATAGPDGWSREQIEAPLVVPDWLR